MNEEEAERKELSLEAAFIPRSDCCENLLIVLSSEGFDAGVIADGTVAVELNIELSCFSFFFFFESTQNGQNHLPFGAALSPTHTKWNHWVSHC